MIAYAYHIDRVMGTEMGVRGREVWGKREERARGTVPGRGGSLYHDFGVGGFRIAIFSNIFQKIIFSSVTNLLSKSLSFGVRECLSVLDCN